MYEKAELERAEKELSEKKEELKKYAVKSGYITSDEIETSEEIKNLIDSVDENGIKSIIVDRLMAQKNEETIPVLEKSEIKTTETASLTCDEESSDYKSVMKRFLGK